MTKYLPSFLCFGWCFSYFPQPVCCLSPPLSDFSFFSLFSPVIQTVLVNQWGDTSHGVTSHCIAASLCFRLFSSVLITARAWRLFPSLLTSQRPWGKKAQTGSTRRTVFQVKPCHLESKLRYVTVLLWASGSFSKNGDNATAALPTAGVL